MIDDARRPPATPGAAPSPVRDQLSDLLPGSASRTTAALFIGVALVHLAAQLLPAPVVLDLAPGLVVIDSDAVARVTQWFLMPLLALTVWFATSRPRRRLVLLALVALLASTAGDAVPDFVDEQWSFATMVAYFACAQVAYSVAFWPYRRRSILRRPVLVAPYAVLYLALVVTTATMLGRAPMSGGAVVGVVALVGTYGLLLVAMAVLATGVHRLAGVGAGLFVLSDALIGLSNAGVPWYAMLPAGGAGFVIMATYIGGQALIAVGVLKAVGDGTQRP